MRLPGAHPRLFDGQTPNQGRRIDHKTLLDSDPCLAVEVLCAGMMSGLTSPSRSWFDLALAPEELMELPGAREWVLEVKKHLEDVFAKSNVYSVLHGFYQEIAVFGTAAFCWKKTRKKACAAVRLPLANTSWAPTLPAA